MVRSYYNITEPLSRCDRHACTHLWHVRLACTCIYAARLSQLLVLGVTTMKTRQKRRWSQSPDTLPCTKRGLQTDSESVAVSSEKSIPYNHSTKNWLPFPTLENQPTDATKGL